MKTIGLHPGLEAGLAALATRITDLRLKTSEARGLEKMEKFDEIEELEQRYKVLEDRLRRRRRPDGYDRGFDDA